MLLTAHRKHKIYLAAIMGYGLGSNNPEEVALYNKIKHEVKEDNRDGNKGVIRED